MMAPSDWIFGANEWEGFKLAIEDLSIETVFNRNETRTQQANGSPDYYVLVGNVREVDRLSVILHSALPIDHLIVFKAGQRNAYANGQFSRNIHEIYFSFHADAGQHLRVKIVPLTPELVTAGIVIYPSGKQDGGPGGVVFNSRLTETGKYRIRVTQRFADTNGRFRVLVEIYPNTDAKD